MLRRCAVLGGVVGAVLVATAVVTSSAVILLIGLPAVVIGLLAYLFGRSRTDQVVQQRHTACSSPQQRHDEAPSIPADEDTAASGSSPHQLDRPSDPVAVPASLDVQSVADAFYSSAKSAGSVVHVSIWQTDGASGDAAMVADIGEAPEVISPRRSGIDSALSAGTTVLETFRVGGDTAEERVYWHYVVPVSFSGAKGVAALDFEAAEPDIEALNRIAAALRLPLAAALALTSARKESEAARALLESAGDLSRLLDPEKIVSTTLRRALDLTNATSGSIMLYADDGATMRIAASVGLRANIIAETAVRPGDGISGWVALSGQPLVVEDLPGTPSNRVRNIRSAVSVPIGDDDGILGVLNVGTRAHPSPFTNTDLTTLEALARHSAVALRNARAVASTGDIFFDTLRALALALETKDPYALGGTDRVLEYSRRLGEVMGLGVEEAQALEIAAMLHDIGMSSTAEEAMVTPRPLSTVERAMLKMHPVIAAEILEQAPALRAVAPIVYHHHERYDGTGYAGGIRGEAIPLGARILAVADGFVAMTSDRPHRPAMSESEAVEELREHAGSQFDPAIVEAFVSVVLGRENQVSDNRP